MRHHVPFVGERKIVRADDEQARSKRTIGKVIEEIVGDGKVESSWDDVVPDGWSDTSSPTAPPTASASIILPSVHLPVKGGAKTVGKSTFKKSALSKPVGSRNAISFSDTATMDWVRINNGRSLRVSIYGIFDSNLRREWRRLLDDPDSVDIHEFEFNLSETPTLSLTGLGMLLLFKERKGAKRDHIRLCNCNKEVAQLLRWSGMEEYFAIENTQISDMR
jgi:anti-anti-sigma regulatory factor